MIPAAIHRLSTNNLQALAASLRSGPLSLGLSRHSVARIAGWCADDVFAYLQHLTDAGFSAAQSAVVIEAVAETQAATANAGSLIDLIMSGPRLPGIPLSDTMATVRSLVIQANRELVMVGYAVHNARAIFELVATRMTENPALRVVLCLDISRPHGDTSLDSEIVRRFILEFREKHWPWRNMPEIYYDPRSLSEDPLHRSSMHAKCVIADRKRALITSANFTEAAWLRNIELGVLMRDKASVRRLSEYVDGLIAAAALLKCEL